MVWRDLWTKFLQILTLQTIAEQILFEIAQSTGHNECTHNWKCWQQPEDTFNCHHQAISLIYFAASEQK